MPQGIKGPTGRYLVEYGDEAGKISEFSGICFEARVGDL